MSSINPRDFTYTSFDGRHALSVSDDGSVGIESKDGAWTYFPHMKVRVLTPHPHGLGVFPTDNNDYQGVPAESEHLSSRLGEIVVPIAVEGLDDVRDARDTVDELVGSLRAYTDALHAVAAARERLEAVTEQVEIRDELSDVLDGAGVTDFNYELDENGGLERARVRFNAKRKVYIRQGEQGTTLYGVTELEIVE